MENTEIMAEPEIRCGRCDTISKVATMDGLGDEHFQTHTCPSCGMEFEVTLKVEWLED